MLNTSPNFLMKSAVKIFDAACVLFKIGITYSKVKLFLIIGVMMKKYFAMMLGLLLLAGGCSWSSLNPFASEEKQKIELLR